MPVSPLIDCIAPAITPITPTIQQDFTSVIALIIALATIPDFTVDTAMDMDIIANITAVAAMVIIPAVTTGTALLAYILATKES